MVRKFIKGDIAVYHQMSSTLQRYLHRTTFIPKSLQFALNAVQFRVLRYYKEKEVMNLLTKIFAERDCQLKANEAFLIYSLARAQKSLSGEFAEVGVYQGSSAKIICEAKGDTPFHLFDTFAGLPQTQKIDQLFQEKQYRSSREAVEHYLIQYPGVYIHPGLFPATAEHLKHKKFSFVHLDADIYQSTWDALQFFYVRMVPGGIILTHDYAQAAGVKKAFTEFFKDKPESIIELAESQALIIKR